MWTEVEQKQFKTVRVVAIALLVVAPIICLIVANVVDVQPQSGGEQDIMFYVLMILAVVQGGLAFIIERFQFAQYRRNTGTPMTPVQLLFSISIIKVALVEAIFIYALVVVLIGGPFERMLMFYPIGIIWAFVHWPRRERWERTLEALERP